MRAHALVTYSLASIVNLAYYPPSSAAVGSASTAVDMWEDFRNQVPVDTSSSFVGSLVSLGGESG